MIDSSRPTSLLAFQGTPLDQALGQPASPGGTTGAAGGNGAAARPQGGGGDSLFLLLVLGLLAFMFIMTIFTGRRQRRQREAMLAALRKHDRVMTSGGIIGFVVEIKPRTVVLKVDESSNTRITFSREAIQQVLESSDAAATESKS